MNVRWGMVANGELLPPCNFDCNTTKPNIEQNRAKNRIYVSPEKVSGNAPGWTKYYVMDGHKLKDTPLTKFINKESCEKILEEILRFVTLKYCASFWGFLVLSLSLQNIIFFYITLLLYVKQDD